MRIFDQRNQIVSSQVNYPNELFLMYDENYTDAVYHLKKAIIIAKTIPDNKILLEHLECTLHLLQEEMQNVLNQMREICQHN